MGIVFGHGTVDPKAPGEEEGLVGDWSMGTGTGLEDQRPWKNLGEKPSLAPVASGEIAESRPRTGRVTRLSTDPGPGREGGADCPGSSF